MEIGFGVVDIFVVVVIVGGFCKTFFVTRRT